MKQTIIIFVTVLFLSCSKREKIIGTWRSNQIWIQTETDSLILKSPSEHSIICLSSNQNFVLNDELLKEYQIATCKLGIENSELNLYGKWVSDSRNKNFSIVNKRKGRFKLEINNDNKLVLSLIDSCSNNSGIDSAKYVFKLIFDKVNNLDISKSKYPFTEVKFNTWRISNNNVGKAEVFKRVYNSLEFFLCFLKHHEEHKISAYKNFTKPIPLKMYGNGIALNENEAWESLFNDYNDAMLSYDIFKKAFKFKQKISSEIKGSLSKKIWIIEQMIEELKKYKSTFNTSS